MLETIKGIGDTIGMGWAVLGVVWLPLVLGLLGLWLLSLGKKDAKLRGTGQGWAKAQWIVALVMVLASGWQAYGVMHPSEDEVQWKREAGEYGLMN